VPFIGGRLLLEDALNWGWSSAAAADRVGWGVGRTRIGGEADAKSR
jgi:hypothetical protein